MTGKRAAGQAVVELVVLAIESGGVWPDANTPIARTLRDYLNPAGDRFRKDIHDRIAHLRPPPGKRAKGATDQNTPATLQGRYDRAVDLAVRRLEATGEWPKSDTMDHRILTRAMRKEGSSDRREWAIRRIEAVRPEKVRRDRDAAARDAAAALASIKAGWSAPPPWSREGRALQRRLRVEDAGAGECTEGLRDAIYQTGARAVANDVAGAMVQLVGEIERTGRMPGWYAPGGRELRAWLRPTDRRFRPAVWRRIEACAPNLLDHQMLERAQGQAEDLVQALEAGAAWPARSSPAGDILYRVLNPDGLIATPAQLARLKLVRADEVRVALSKKKGGRPIVDLPPILA